MRSYQHLQFRCKDQVLFNQLNRKAPTSSKPPGSYIILIRLELWKYEFKLHHTKQETFNLQKQKGLFVFQKDRLIESYRREVQYRFVRYEGHLPEASDEDECLKQVFKRWKKIRILKYFPAC